MLSQFYNHCLNPVTEEVVDEMLRGTYTLDKSGMDEVHASAEMANFIKALKIPHSTATGEPTPVMDDDIDSETYTEMMNGTRESTASSPSGIHYGHYKAACESELLTAVNLLFMVLPFKVGIPLHRWTCSLHCMIQKVKKPYKNKPKSHQEPTSYNKRKMSKLHTKLNQN